MKSITIYKDTGHLAGLYGIEIDGETAYECLGKDEVLQAAVEEIKKMLRGE